MTSKSAYKGLEQRIHTLEKELACCEARKDSSGIKQQYFEDILNNANLPIYLKDSEYKYIFVNHQFERVAHVPFARIRGRDDFAIFPQPVAQLFRSQDEEVVERGGLVEFEETISLPDGLQTFITAKFPLFDNQGRLQAVGGVCTDITARKQAEKELKKAHDELEQRVADRTDLLEQKSERLMETNIALKILLEKREEDRKELESKVMIHIEKLICPYLEQLRMGCSKDSQRVLIKIIQSNLDEITAPFTINQKSYLSLLTPAQIKIVNLIKQGHTTKEIASLLNLSPSTISCHRQEIRKRLSLTNSKINLQTVLTKNNYIE